MFAPIHPDMKAVLVRDLQNIQVTALHTFAGEQDYFIKILNDAIAELNNLPVEDFNG